MRVIKIYILISLFILSCNGERQETESAEVIQYFIETTINQRTFDIRVFDPPPSPEMQDRTHHKGRIKPDSIIERLPPLQVYIGRTVTYEHDFKSHLAPEKGYDFIGNSGKKTEKSLNVNDLSKKEGIVLHSFSSQDFEQLFRSVNLQEGYGGFISFKNLFYSDDGKRAYFEFVHYKRKLNSSTSAIYAEKQQDGTWKFKSKLISIS